MTRKILFIIGLCFGLGYYAGSAAAAVTYNGYPVRVALVGGIDASPCPDPSGCVRGVVEIRYRGHSGTRLVRCGHPRRLHVVRVQPTRLRPRAVVFACGRNYFWRLPR